MTKDDLKALYDRTGDLDVLLNTLKNEVCGTCNHDLGNNLEEAAEIQIRNDLAWAHFCIDNNMSELIAVFHEAMKDVCPPFMYLVRLYTIERLAISVLEREKALKGIGVKVVAVGFAQS